MGREWKRERAVERTWLSNDTLHCSLLLHFWRALPQIGDVLLGRLALDARHERTHAQQANQLNTTYAPPAHIKAGNMQLLEMGQLLRVHACTLTASCDACELPLSLSF